MKFIKRLFVFILFTAISLLLFIFIVKKHFPLDYSHQIEIQAEKYRMDEFLIYSVIKAESNFKSDAVSHKNAIGLMQITPATGKWCAEKMNIRDYTTQSLYDPELNIKIGAFYLAHLLDLYDGNINLSLAAYNAGLGNVGKWLDNPSYSTDGEQLDVIPFKETRDYITKIDIFQKIYRLRHKIENFNFSALLSISFEYD